MTFYVWNCTEYLLISCVMHENVRIFNLHTHVILRTVTVYIRYIQDTRLITNDKLTLLGFSLLGGRREGPGEASPSNTPTPHQ